MKRDILTEIDEINSVCNFNEKNFYDYILKSFLISQNIKTDDIYVENVSDEATVKKVPILQAFIDLNFSKNPKIDNEFSRKYPSPFFDIWDDLFVDEETASQQNLPFVEYIIKNEVSLASETITPEHRCNTIFLQGNAGAGKSTLTQYIALWNWALWLKHNRGAYPLDDNVQSFLRDNRYNKYSSMFETNHRVPVTFRIKLSDYGKYLFNIQAKDDYITLKTVMHFIAFTLWVYVKKIAVDTNTYLLWGNEMQSNDSSATNIYMFCSDLLKSGSQVVYLFDGLDEVKFAREELIVYLKNFLKNYIKYDNSKNLAIVTSRVENARDLLEEKVNSEEANSEYSQIKSLFDEKCYLTVLEKKKVKECVNNFCNAKYDVETARSTYSAIMESYINKPNTRQLMKTPLEVTMVCLVYQGNKEIPENDAKLYRSYIDMYYSREKERLKANNSKYKVFYDHPCTKDTIYHILEWIGYQLEIDNVPAVSWDDVIEEAKRFNRNEDGFLKYRTLDNNYFDNIAEVTLTKLNLLNSTIDNFYEMDEVHKTVKEFLAALYIVSPENENDFEKNIIKVILFEKDVVFNFIMWKLSSYPSRERNFRNSLSLNFSDLDSGKNECKNVTEICELINVGSKISSELLNSRIYKDRTPEKTVVEKLATHINTDLEDPQAISNIIFLLKKDSDYSPIILNYIEKFIEENHAMTVNLFRVLVKIIEENILIDKKTYPHIYKAIKSDRFGKNILINARKFRTEISEDLISIVLERGISINVSENNDEFLCNDLNQIKYIEGVKSILSTGFDAIEDIYYFLYKQLDTVYLRNNKRTIYGFPPSESVLSFKYLEYDFKNSSSKKQYLAFVDSVRDCGLYACSELLKCIGWLTYDNMINYAQNLSSESYRRELSQIFGDNYNNLSKHNFPAVILTHRSLKKEISDHLVEIIKSAFPNKSKKRFKSSLTKLEDALDLYSSKFPCRIVGSNINRIEPWLDTFHHIYGYSINNNRSDSFDILAFVFSNYEWSCQHGSVNIKYDDIHDILKPYHKNINDLLFNHYESLLGTDHIYLLHYILSSTPTEQAESLKAFSTDKLYNSFHQYVLEQMAIDENSGESFLCSESYRTMLQFLNSLIFSGAKQYWDFFAKTFLLVRNSKEFIVSFSFSSLPCEKTDSFRMIYIINLIKKWYKNANRQGIDKCTAMEIISSIEEIQNEDQAIILELVINYLLYNFRDNADSSLVSLFIELLKQLSKKDKFYLSRIKLREYLEKHLKTII